MSDVLDIARARRDALKTEITHLDANLEEGPVEAVELDYPYRLSSPELFSGEDEREFTASLRAAGEELGLRFTRGSDAHRAADLERLYGPASA